MTALVHSRAACLPAQALSSLSRYRAHPGLRVVVEPEHLWLFWPAENPDLARSLLALPGARLLLPRGELWYPPGAHLPDFRVPDSALGESLATLLVPVPVQPINCVKQIVGRIGVRLALDDRPRPVIALEVPLAMLARWADLAPEVAFEDVLATRKADRVLLVGKLPGLAGQRWWGKRILVPAGYRPDPDVSTEILADAIRLPAGDLALLGPEGVQLLPRARFAPLTRAGVRLALREGIA